VGVDETYSDETWRSSRTDVKYREMSRPSLTIVIRTAGLFVIAALMLAHWPSMAVPPIEVRYIANEGFLITSGEQKVLVDGLLRRDLLARYLGGGDALYRVATQAEAPFDDIDLVLITHVHWDHFDADTTAAFLGKSSAPVICPDQVAQQLADKPGLSKRIHAVTPNPSRNERHNVGDVTVDVFRLSHSPYFVVDKRTGERRNKHAGIENLGFLLHLGGRTVFHPGDSGLSSPEEFPAAKMPNAGVDVLFAGTVFWGEVKKCEEVVQKIIRPKHIVGMHLAPNANPRRSTDHRAAYPNFVSFQKPLERRTF
jgi:L-ascorbate metabolism protein UlaG (beta-lactamase superfamily)